MKTGNVNFQVINEAKQIAQPPTGILFLGGICKRGPVHDPKYLISSPRQFRHIFGNVDIDSDFPRLVMEALKYGARIRVNRITDTDEEPDVAETAVIGMGGISGAVAEITSITTIAKVGSNLDGKYFLISAGNGGTDYYVWFDGPVDPTIPGRTGVKITLSGDKTAAEVATAVHDALEAISGTPFSSVIGGSPFTTQLVTAATAGICKNASAGNSGFTVTVNTPGVAGTPSTSLFQLVSKFPGEDYNNMVATISNATNNNSDYFNLTLSFSNDDQVTEVYENLYIDNHPDVASSDYLQKLELNSYLASVVYSDLSALGGQLRPTNGTYLFDGGTDGSAPGVEDYIGNSSDRTGFYAWDPYDDAYAVAYPEMSPTDLSGIAVAGAAYAAARKDLVYYQHLDNLSTDAATYITEKQTDNVNSPYIVYTGGGYKITDTITGAEREISELTHILGQMAYVQNNYAPWASFFGMNRGVHMGVLGVVNNFGSPASLSDLDLLASNCINMVINRNGLNMLWDDYTGENTPSPMNFACIMNLLIYMQRSLRPTLESYLGEPTDFTLLKDLYYTVRPFLEALIKGRALASYEWKGDQFATSFDDLDVNTADDMALGKITIELEIVTVAPLKSISVKIVLTRAGVSFNF